MGGDVAKYRERGLALGSLAADKVELVENNILALMF